MVYLILRSTWRKSSSFVWPEMPTTTDGLMNFFAE